MVLSCFCYKFDFPIGKINDFSLFIFLFTDKNIIFVHYPLKFEERRALLSL